MSELSAEFNVPKNDLNPDWQQSAIRELLLEGLKEKKLKRRWGIFFKLVFIAYIAITILWVFFYGDQKNAAAGMNKDHTAVIEVIGEISKDSIANAEHINNALNKAFSSKQVKGIVLRINSPGGSPVQARQIYNKIIKLRSEHPNIPIYAAIEDLGTSAAYLIASATDRIYADETSLIGSIGVVINSFGFVDTLKKLGIERRIYTAGKNKAMLDPFSPKNPEHEAFIQQQLELTHKAFIKNVVDRRPQILQQPEQAELLSGKFWVGQAAMELGLIDSFGDVDHIAEQVIQVALTKNYNVQPNLLDKLGFKIKSMISVF